MIANADEYAKAQAELEHFEDRLRRLQRDFPTPAKGLTKAGVRKMIARLHEELAAAAREESDYVSEQFMQWFLKEQVEEVDLFSSLLDVAERSRERPMDIEDYIAREGVGGDVEDPTAPPAAGAGDS